MEERSERLEDEDDEDEDEEEETEREYDSEDEEGVVGEYGYDSEDGVEEMTLTVRWSGKEYTVRVCGDDSVAELKRRICEATTVLPKRQKLLYPKLAAKLNDDSILLSQLNLKPSVKMTMIGSVPLLNPNLFPN